jgi:cobalt/nickel transport system permease protein
VAIKSPTMLVLALHIPDGFFSPRFALLGWALIVPALAWALHAWARSQEDEALPLAGLLAAFLFAAQTLQFPVAGGTTGHLLGSVLACILLGPAGGLAVIASVTLMQALLFSVGGLLSLGWNLTNMGLLSGWVGYSFYLLFRRARCPLGVAAFAGAWLGTQVGSVATCLQLAAAGMSPLAISLPAMLAVQGAVGVGEGAVTASALAFLQRVRPQWVSCSSGAVPGWLCLGALLVACCLPPSVFGVQNYAGLMCVGALLLLALPWVAWGRLRPAA